MTYHVTYSISDGIERIVYTPDQRRFATPIVMQHGMWHGAWCWEPWQKLFAEWGWESHAHSLPGHGKSSTQRPIRWCTLQYYYEFLNTEIKRQPRRPILMGHSMGGALTQWYLKCQRLSRLRDSLPSLPTTGDRASGPVDNGPLSRSAV